ncbi:MAG TPA: FAD-binding oxidoreductase [Anaerolineaceae bacterium]|nr:FAD-binding oxidoreductase [Anaerolineaceae bacterium]
MHEIQSKPAPQAEFSRVKCIQGFETIQSEYPVYLSDESKLSPKPFDYLFFPKNEAELAAVLQEMSRQNIKVTIAAARTGLVGGSVPQEGALVSLEHLDQVEAIFYDRSSGEWRVQAQTSVTLKGLDAMLRSKHFPDLEKSEDLLVRQNLEAFKQDPNSYFYPPDPTEMSASLGGSVVTNASGARTYRYGPTRAWVRGIRVFLANGEYLDIPRGKYFASPTGEFVIYRSSGEASSFFIPNYSMPKTKSTAGFFAAPQMDLIDLFIGSEGVLGVVTRVEVALIPREDKVSIVLFLESDEQAIRLTEALRADKRLQLDFLEFYSGNALDLLRNLQTSEPSTVGMPAIPGNAHSAIFIEMSFDPRAESPDYQALDETVSSCGASLANSWAGYETRELDRFKLFRHMIPETINSILAERKKQIPGLHKLGTDMAVPDEYLMEIWELYRSQCEALQLEWIAFGHIGNNHIHVNILPKTMEDLKKGMELYGLFAQKVVEMGGAVSAEHGIGKIKSKFLKLMFSPAQIDQMKTVKDAMDPQGILNPNDIFSLEGSR